VEDDTSHWDRNRGVEIPSYTIIQNVRLSITAYTVGPPEAPAHPDPADGSDSEAPGSITLSWSSGTGSTEFDVYFWEEGESCPGSPTACCLTESAYELGYTLEPLTTYYWKVTAKNVAGSTCSPEWSFTTGDGLPGTPVLTYPADEDKWVSTDPAVSWKRAKNADSYELYVNEVSESGLQPPPVWTGAGTSAELTGLLPDTAYYIGVAAVNAYGTTQGEQQWFITRTAYPEWIETYYSDTAQKDPDADPDGDLMLNKQEYEYPTDPSIADTDGDGITDYKEMISSWDPLDAASPGDNPEPAAGGCSVSRSANPGGRAPVYAASVLLLLMLFRRKRT
jgi:hypothetical protein